MYQCKTKYPIMFIHGAGYRDRKRNKNWGRIPRTLEKLGAKIFYGRSKAWADCEENAKIIMESIDSVLSETNSEKVNLICHSRGGIEARYVACRQEMKDKIASITTVSTPHRGSVTVSALLRFPNKLIRFVSHIVNIFYKVLGEKNPDFYNSVRVLTTEYMEKFNAQYPNTHNVYYQSFSGKMSKAYSDFLLWIPFCVVKKSEGENDGLVSVKSAEWGEYKGVIESGGRTGVSHLHCVDGYRRKMSKKNAQGKYNDICDFYINVVSDLKQRGL